MAIGFDDVTVECRGVEYLTKQDVPDLEKKYLAELNEPDLDVPDLDSMSDLNSMPMS